MTSVTPLHKYVPYRGYQIEMTYRPLTNDWAYRFTHTTTITIDGHGRTYNKAIESAQSKADILLRGRT